MGEIEKSNNSIEIPGSQDYLADVDDFLEGWLRQRGVPDDTVADLAIAITELVNNAIKHGSKSGPGRVALYLCYERGEVEATITDHGRGFDPDRIPNPIAEENLLKEIGRGIFIVRSLMDDVQFNFPPEGGTRVTIRKKIT